MIDLRLQNYTRTKQSIYAIGKTFVEISNYLLILR